MFPIISANNMSKSLRRLVHGIGTNDADYVTKPVINGKRVSCPYYRTWLSMMDRCYSYKYHKKFPTYIGCSVCDEWMLFSNFKAWMEQQDWEGKCLDKDIIVPNNKVYSPDTCCFVHGSLNNLLTDHSAKRGNYQIGVHWDKSHNRFRASCRYNGKTEHLGYFDKQETAHEAYLKRKHEIISESAMLQTDDRIRDGLIRHAELLLQGV